MILHGDCREKLKELPDNHFHACVTDPPYEISFMSKKWDQKGVSFEPDTWKEILRVLRPGGHLLVFGGSRTFHRMACAIEDAGFEIRDTIMWIYGSGFPKSMDVSKAFDKAAGVEREIVGTKVGLPGYSLKPNDTEDHNRDAYGKYTDSESECAITAPTTEEAKQWEGWGTTLKPAFEPIILARKPLEGTVVNNIKQWGCGALNIDISRVPANGDKLDGSRVSTKTEGWDRPWKHDDDSITACKERIGSNVAKAEALGRFPANVIHDGSEEVLELFPESKGQQGNVRGNELSHTGGEGTNCYGEYGRVPFAKRGDSGSAARFFYCAKASRSERGKDNNHPTVKPLALMEYLVKLVCPQNGLLLDPFLGSGTTALAAKNYGIQWVGVEAEEEYIEIAERRLKG